MKKHGKLLTIGVTLLAALVFTLQLPEGHQPRYQGHSLSAWLQSYRANPEGTAERQMAERAIRSIGTNALPGLLQDLAYERPQWNRALSRALPMRLLWLSTFLLPRPDRRTDSILAFTILGTNAAPAIPALGAILHDYTRPMPSKAATYALCAIGDPALPTLAKALADTNTPKRYNIPVAISISPPRGITTNRWVRMLLVAISDQDPDVRFAATNALEKIAPDFFTNAPAR